MELPKMFPSASLTCGAIGFFPWVQHHPLPCGFEVTITILIPRPLPVEMAAWALEACLGNPQRGGRGPQSSPLHLFLRWSLALSEPPRPASPLHLSLASVGGHIRELRESSANPFPTLKSSFLL